MSCTLVREIGKLTTHLTTFSLDGAHTFHGLHKDLLFLTGVLFVQQHAVEDAAKRACQRQTAGFYFLGKGQERGTAFRDRNVTSLIGRHAWLICGQRWTGFSLKMLCLLKRLRSFGFCLTDKRDSLELRGLFIASKDRVHHLLCLNCHPVAPGLY